MKYFLLTLGVLSIIVSLVGFYVVVQREMDDIALWMSSITALLLGVQALVQWFKKRKGEG